MTNISRARALLKSLVQEGVREIVLCPGARNAPLVTVLSKSQGLKIHSFFDERSAGFFALGRIQVTGRPVAVCTTSGTAVAELLPAVIEADHQTLPLIVLSADRPKHYRGSGSPQSIIHPGLFSHYVENTWDLDGANCEVKIRRRPVHINICFDEPLLDEPATDWNLVHYMVERPFKPLALHGSDAPVEISSRKPLVIVSGLRRFEAERIVPLLKKWQRPLILEGLSGLRGHSELRSLEIKGGKPDGFSFDGVIRIGSVPTLRFWRDLETLDWPVWNFSDLPWSGLARAREVHALADLNQIKAEFEPWTNDERTRDESRWEKLNDLLTRYPYSESSWVRRISQWIPQRAKVFLGNSLPIREWDLAADRSLNCDVSANRGVNGIDGLVSTFLGSAEEGRSNWAVLGDLSALYDLNGLWALRDHHVNDLTLVILNNGGGKIFAPMFNNQLFENRHEFSFADWAHMWGCRYHLFKGAVEVPSDRTSRPRVLEVIPDENETEAFWRAWKDVP